MKRFADVIVGAKFKSDNPVNGIFAGADDNNRASLKIKSLLLPMTCFAPTPDHRYQAAAPSTMR